MTVYVDEVSDIGNSDVWIKWQFVPPRPPVNPSRATFEALQVLASMLISKHANFSCVNGSKTMNHNDIESFQGIHTLYALIKCVWAAQINSPDRLDMYI